MQVTPSLALRSLRTRCWALVTAAALLLPAEAAASAPAQATAPRAKPATATMTTTPPPTEAARATDAASPEGPITPAADALDRVELANGKVVLGRVRAVAEGAYVTIETDGAPHTLPWAEVRRVRLARRDAEGVDASVDLEIVGPTFEPPMKPSVDTPFIEMQTRDGRPVSLLRLRSSSAETQDRMSTGYDEVCRAPCGRPIEAGSRRFFVDPNPWTASKVFELPKSDHIELQVRPGRVRMRKAGVGTLIGAAVAMPVSITLLSLPNKSRTVTDVGITMISLACLALPIGLGLFLASRAKVKVNAKKATKRSRRKPRSRAAR